MRPANLDTSIRPAPAEGDAANTATIEAQFDPTEPLLLGIYGSDRKRGAILRLPNGIINKVKVGDRVGGERVLAIAETSVTVVHNGETRRFTIPGA